MTGLLGAALLVAASWCQEMRTTGYVRTDYGPHGRTFDGTSIYADEAIAAASWNVPIDSIVFVEGLGSFRVADRGGGLGSSGWIDVAVWDRATAFAITGTRRVCVYPPGG